MVLVLFVGGVKEQYGTIKGKHQVYVKNRKGFIRIAIKNGANLVPVYSFGESDTMNKTENDGILAFFIGGRGIFQYSFGMLPHKIPIHTVVGKPIEVTRNSEPSDKEIDELHKGYVEALTELFDDHKEKFGIEKNVLLKID